jgi:hypothetical protein
MKVTVTDKSIGKPFPKVMRLKECGSLVYFTKSEYGLPIYDGNVKFPWTFSEITADGWHMEDFEDFDSTITIDN